MCHTLYIDSMYRSVGVGVEECWMVLWFWGCVLACFWVCWVVCLILYVELVWVAWEGYEVNVGWKDEGGWISSGDLLLFRER